MKSNILLRSFLTIAFFSAIVSVEASGGGSNPPASNPVKGIYDPAIGAQEDRQVFFKWGDWRPEGKYVLGVQTNLAYAMAWGWLAPARNRDYKEGQDIRPISPTGEQTQRTLAMIQENAEAEKIILQIDSLRQEADREFIYTSGIYNQLGLDPLYFLYYKPNLKDLDNFNINSANYKDWYFSGEEVFQEAKKYGQLEEIKKRIEETQEKYDLARDIDLARGKRIIMYHQCLLEWRKCRSFLSYINHNQMIFINAKKEVQKMKDYKPNKKIDDAKVFIETLIKNNAIAPNYNH